MQDQAPITPAYDLGHYLRPLRRQRKWLVIAVVGGFVLGSAYAVISKPTYSAAARVLVDPPPASTQTTVTATNSRTPGVQVNMDTEAQNVKSLPVGIAAQQILKTSTSPNALLARVSVTVPPNTTILRIACGARSAGVAQACANAFAHAYLNNRAATETIAIDGQIKTLNTQITSAQAELLKYTNLGVQAAKGSSAKVTDFAHVSTATATINTLTAQLNGLNDELPADAGHIQSVAGRGVASKASRLIPPITGLILGLLIGVAAVYGRERFDRFVRHRDDLVRAGVELIAEFEPASGRRGAVQRAGDSALRTRFDQRVASIVAGAFDGEGVVVYVAAVSPGQSDADVAGHLAATLASVGHQVEMVRPLAVQVVEPAEAPVATPTDDLPPVDSTSTLLGWPSLNDEAPSTELAVATPQRGVLAPVDTPAESVPLGIRMQLELARRRAQFVIIDGDPAVTDAQAYVLAGLSDVSLLVVDPNATTRLDLAEVVDQLSVTGTELLGAVICRLPRPKPPVGADRSGSLSSSRRSKRNPPVAAMRFGETGRNVRTTGFASDSNGSGPSRPYLPVDAAR